MYKDNLFLEIEKLKKKLKQKDAPIGIQLPEGLKQFSLEIAELLKEFQPILFVEPCYGGCDVKDKQAKELGCKCFIHIGHEKMYKTVIKTYFLPLSYVLDKTQKKFILQEIEKLGFKQINLVTTVNYLKEILSLKKKLEKKGIEVLPAKKTTHVKEHMVLGCDVSTIENNNQPIIFIGDGYFHVNNICFVFKNNVYLINPILKQTEKININENFIKRRYGLAKLALTSKNFGILVSLKQGQKRLSLAKEIKKELESLGKKAYILVSDFIKEDYIIGMNIDCYVNTGCPRLSYDDNISFKKPIITPTEVKLLKDFSKEIEIDLIKEIEK